MIRSDTLFVSFPHILKSFQLLSLTRSLIVTVSDFVSLSNWTFLYLYIYCVSLNEIELKVYPLTSLNVLTTCPIAGIENFVGQA